jgi:hypothetical protein
MSEEQFATHNSGAGFEKEDLNPIGVLFFMVGLAVAIVLIYFIVIGMYKYLDAYDRANQAPTSPMAVKTGADPATMNFGQIKDKVDSTFPAPVLEYNERSQFTPEVAREDQVLGSYDWVDQKAGVVRIPIDQAMDLVAKRGLPVIPPGEASKAGASAKTSTPPSNTQSGGPRRDLEKKSR